MRHPKTYRPPSRRTHLNVSCDGRLPEEEVLSKDLEAAVLDGSKPVQNGLRARLENYRWSSANSIRLFDQPETAESSLMIRLFSGSAANRLGENNPPKKMRIV
jgi:hypothetical protein